MLFQVISQFFDIFIVAQKLSENGYNCFGIMLSRVRHGEEQSDAAIQKK